MIDAGLIGFGVAGRAFHAPIIHAVPGLRLAAILQRSGSASAEIYPDARIVRSLDELLAIGSIRLVVIATPNDSHFFMRNSALRRAATSWWTSRSRRLSKKRSSSLRLRKNSAA